MIQKTSLDSFISIMPELNHRQLQVYNIIQCYKGMNLCNREIGLILGLPINSITGRVKELRDQNLIINSGVKKDDVTNRMVMTWKVKV